MIEDELTLYQIMSEDMSIFSELTDTNLIHVEVMNDNDEVVYEEKSHIYAWESLVRFATQVISQHIKIQKQIQQLKDDE